MKKKTKCAASAHERAAKGSGLLYENLGRNLIRGLLIFGLIFGMIASVSANVCMLSDVRVTNDVNTSVYPSLAVDSNNNVHISWYDDRDENSEIYYKKCDNNGNNLTGDVRVTNDASDSGLPSIAVDSDNNVHISWVDGRDGNSEIYYKKYDNDGNILTGDVRVTNDASNSEDPSIAVDSDNNVHISWVDGRDGNSEIYYKKLDNNGNNLTVDVRVTNDASDSGLPSIAVDSGNNVHISWVDGRDGNSEIYYKKLDNNGNNLTVDVRVTNDANNSMYPSIAVDSDNNVHISWFDDRDGNWEIYYKKCDNNGNILTGDVRVTNDASNSEDPSIAVDSDNNVHISWEDNRDGNPEIYYKKYDNNGNALTGDVRVTNDASNSGYPSIAVDSNNNVHISWVDGRNGNSEIYYKKLCDCTDNDGDGYSPSAVGCGHVDCDDNNDAIYPGATEICNDIDDDCDGNIDEDLTQPTTCGVGACSGNTGTETCTAGVWGGDTCDSFAGATAETCNNIDDDCDGNIDEDLTQPTTCGVGACSGNTGTETCTAGNWSGDTCDPFTGATAETCNNIDDDCDGNIDEDLTQPTTCGVGACSGNTGTETCAAGLWGGSTCDPFTGATAETCNNIDDDCDGSIDDGLVRSTTCGVGIYSGNTGTETCTAGLWGGDTCDSLGWDPGKTIPLSLLYDSEQHTATFEVSGQSMWEDGNPPGDSNLEILPSQSLLGSTGFDESTTFKIPYAGDVIESIVSWFGGNFDSEVTVGGALDAASGGHIGLRSELSNFGDGTVDVRYPEVVVFEYPAANTFWAGDNLELDTDTTPSGGAYLRTTPAPVEFSLIFDLVLKETLSGRIDYGFGGSGDFSETIIDLDGDDTTILHLKEYEGWYSDTSAYTYPNTHPEMPFASPATTICEGTDCFKLLTGSTGYLEMPYPKPTTNGVNAQGDLVASDTNVFGNAEIDLNHASKYGKVLDIDTGEHAGFEFSYKLLDADISLISKVKQNLKFSPTNYIRFDFSDHVEYEGSFTNSITTLAGSPVNVEFPPGRTDTITVTPTVLLKNDFHNKYVHSDNNIFKVEVGTFSSSVPGVPLLPEEYSIPDLFGDWDWVCTERVCWNPCWPWDNCRRCDCVLGYWEPEMMSVGPYTTPSFDIGPFGPAYTTNPSYDPKVTVVDQTFELGGFEAIPLTSFVLDPQVKPYPVPIPAGWDPYEVNEGSSIGLDGSESYDLDNDPIRLYWDLDNDNKFETESSTPSYLGTDDGTYQVNLMANDPYGYQVAETTVTVHNVAPTMDAGSEQTVNEGDTVNISGSFTDPGWLDTHNATIDRGDETEVESGTLTEENEYPDSTGTVTGSHVYGDDGAYTVNLTVIDDDGGVGTDTLTVTVNNVAPTVDAGSEQTVNEGDTVNISGNFTDPGWFDTHNATIDWGDGTEVKSGALTEENEYPDSTGTVTGSHVYGDDGAYTVNLTVIDDDGGVGTDTLTVTVNNVAPTASIDSMTQPNPQFILPIVHELSFDGSFTDPGWLDTHTSTWNFGDGTVVVPGTLTEENEKPDATGTTTAEHIYSDPGTYTVTLTVTDDDDGVGTDTMQVTVVDDRGALNDINGYIQSLPDTSFKGNPSQRKKAFNNMFTAIDDMLVDMEYQGAIQDLRNNIRAKADGLVDGHLKNDWIMDPEAQQHICMKIDDLTAYLEHLKTLEG